MLFRSLVIACYLLYTDPKMTAESVTEKEKKKKISLKKDIKMVYVEKLEDCNKNRDKRIKGEKVQVELGKNLKNSILSLVEENPKEVMYAYVPVMKLGTFGVDNKFTFYKSDI